MGVSFRSLEVSRSDMKVALCFLAVVALCQAESWLAGPYTMVKRAAEPQRTRFFTGNNALMPELRVLLLEWAPSTLPTRSSTPAPGAAPGTTIGEPTTGFLVDRLFKMEPLDFWPVLLGPHLSIMPREIPVEDKY